MAGNNKSHSFFEKVGAAVAGGAVILAAMLGRGLSMSGDDVMRSVSRSADDLRPVISGGLDDAAGLRPNSRLSRIAPDESSSGAYGSRSNSSDEIVSYSEFEQTVAKLGKEFGEELIQHYIEECVLKEDPIDICFPST